MDHFGISSGIDSQSPPFEYIRELYCTCAHRLTVHKCERAQTWAHSSVQVLSAQVMWSPGGAKQWSKSSLQLATPVDTLTAEQANAYRYAHLTRQRIDEHTPNCTVYIVHYCSACVPRLALHKVTLVRRLSALIGGSVNIKDQRASGPRVEILANVRAQVQIHCKNNWCACAKL